MGYDGIFDGALRVLIIGLILVLSFVIYITYYLAKSDAPVCSEYSKTTGECIQYVPRT